MVSNGEKKRAVHDTKLDYAGCSRAINQRTINFY